MAEPTFSDTLERAYGRLPEHYRLQDAAADGDFPLKRYMALVLDQVGDVEIVLDRLTYTPPDEGGSAGDTSDLVDPATADAGWLDWLAQLVGVVLEPGLSLADRRDAVAIASSGWRAGTKGAVEDAARSVLTGSQYVVAYDHSTAVATLGAGGEWDVLVVTRPSETPGAADVLEAIVSKGAKPAGVELFWEAYEASWDTIEAEFLTWDDVEATGSWDNLQEAGL